MKSYKRHLLDKPCCHELCFDAVSVSSYAAHAYSYAARAYSYAAHAFNDRRFRRLWEKYKQHTMVPVTWYSDNLHLALRVNAVKGNIVECGTWKGGMIAGIADVLGSQRSYYLCDSFEGLPPAKDIDGRAAKEWQANKSGESYHDNCTASEEDARGAMRISAGARSYTILKGWFSDTLPRFPAEPIALLRMDADWYDSTKCILENLAKHVVPSGLIIIDDYYTWEGCTIAVNEFAAVNKWQIRDTKNGVCYVTVTGD